MNAHTTIAKPRAPRAKLSLHPPIAAAPPPPAAPTIVPSSPEPVALRCLRRAPENVRHHRIEEDVDALAQDIAAHGLLQCLIGYRDGELVQVVGGGRRFAALRRLEDEGAIGADFAVPVLIRNVEDAVELSLAENLQQRSMSPVDEFLAFQALMERGTQSEADLAKRFGFSERVVRQRLRLAQLEPEVLDALAERKITLDAAMAYAASQSRDLQLEVFKAETKRATSYRNAHRPDDIRHAIRMKGETTDSALFRFVRSVAGDVYEQRGGRYEDDLFLEGKDAGKTLSHPRLLLDLTREAIAVRVRVLLGELRAAKDWAPTIAGYVVTDNLRLNSYGNAAKAPRGFVRVEKYEHAKVWKTIRNNGLPVHVLVGVNEKGELNVSRTTTFVQAEQKAAIDPPAPAYVGLTPEQSAAAAERQEVQRWACRLAVGPFAGTPLEGRGYWSGHPRRREIDGVPGFSVSVDIFVTEVEVAAHWDAALLEREAERDRWRAQDAAEEADRVRLDELRAMAPPAIVVLDGLAWELREDGSYAPFDDAEDEAQPGWLSLLNWFEVRDIGEVFATREAFDERQADAIAADEDEA